MTTLAFEPIAAKIAKLCDIAEVLAPVEEQRAQWRRSARDEGDSYVNPHIEDFMAHYLTVVRGANELVAAPPFRELLALEARIREEYLPGGPPLSPVYDSYSALHLSSQIPVGLSRETPCSVLARLAHGRPGLARIAELARAVARSHLDLYRATGVTHAEADLTSVRHGKTQRVRLTGPFLRDGDLILGRVLPFDGYFAMAESPYLLRASEEEWLAYLERVCTPAAAEPGASRARPPSAKTSRKDPRSRKRRQASEKAKAPAREDVLVSHLRYGRSWRFWLDYIMDGYLAERRGVAYLAGVPDRPETLPQHDAYAGSDQSLPDDPGLGGAGSNTPGSAPGGPQTVNLTLLDELVRIARERGLHDVTAQVCREGLAAMGLEDTEVSAPLKPLFVALSVYGAIGVDGKTALDHFLDEGRGSAEVREHARALSRGWCSVFELRRIHLDEGFEVMDVLRRKALYITERAATRQVGPRDLIAGWVYQDAGGRHRLEGGVAHVPSSGAAAAIELVKSAKSTLRAPVGVELDWRRKAGLLPFTFIASQMALRAAGPTLVNTSGEALVFSSARFDVLDEAKVRATLARELEDTGDDDFAWIEKDIIIAHLNVGPGRLTARVNSVERLHRTTEKLRRLLGASIRPSLGSIDGGIPSATIDTERPEAPPPELAAAFEEFVLGHLHKRLDEEVPMFGGKTLRQLARSERSRPDAIAWLREQERMLRMNPQTAGVDLRGLWQELGLEYQGLGTDPVR